MFYEIIKRLILQVFNIPFILGILYNNITLSRSGVLT